MLSGLALVASAAGTTATHGKQVRQLQQPVGALAVDGNRVAYDLNARYTSKPNKVLVWNVRTGKTIKVSGKKTGVGDGTSTGAGVFQLAIAGSRVAWLLNEGGNLEATDYLFTSSVTHPKERQVASAMRSGDNCPGARQRVVRALGSVGWSAPEYVIALNRWTTDSQGEMTSGGLYALEGHANEVDRHRSQHGLRGLGRRRTRCGSALRRLGRGLFQVRECLGDG